MSSNNRSGTIKRTGPKLQLNAETAFASLLVAPPAQTDMDIAPRDDVFPGLFMNVSIHEIDFFDKNPRTASISNTLIFKISLRPPHRQYSPSTTYTRRQITYSPFCAVFPVKIC